MFSVCLVPYPPFLARLSVKQVQLSDRMKLLRFMRRDGTVVKYEVSLLGKHRPRRILGALLRDIAFPIPDGDFVRFLLTEDVSNFPFVGWPQRKGSGPVMRFVYGWVWQEEGRYLVALDGLASFTFENHEARKLGQIIAADRSKP